MTPKAVVAQTFTEDFGTSYAPLDASSQWYSSTNADSANGQAKITINGTSLSGYAKPTALVTGVETPVNWPLAPARTCARFLRVEFDLGATTVTGAGIDGRVELVFERGSTSS